MIQFCLFQTFIFLVLAIIATPLCAALYMRNKDSNVRIDKMLTSFAELGFIFVWLQVIAGVAVTLAKLIF